MNMPVKCEAYFIQNFKELGKKSLPLLVFLSIGTMMAGYDTTTAQTDCGQSVDAEPATSTPEVNEEGLTNSGTWLNECADLSSVVLAPSQELLLYENAEAFRLGNLPVTFLFNAPVHEAFGMETEYPIDYYLLTPDSRVLAYLNEGGMVKDLLSQVNAENVLMWNLRQPGDKISLSAVDKQPSISVEVYDWNSYVYTSLRNGSFANMSPEQDLESPTGRPGASIKWDYAYDPIENLVHAYIFIPPNMDSFSFGMWVYTWRAMLGVFQQRVDDTILRGLEDRLTELFPISDFWLAPINTDLEHNYIVNSEDLEYR